MLVTNSTEIVSLETLMPELTLEEITPRSSQLLVFPADSSFWAVAEPEGLHR